MGASGALRGLLAAGISQLGLAIDGTAQEKLLAYVALLEKWNRTHNLTAIRDPERMVTHHVLDALATLPHLPQEESLRLLDVGSGGGAPGIPLAIARPAWRVTLLDRSRKKAAFLRQAVAEVPLSNVGVEAVRVEDYAPRAPFQVVVSRAFADLSMFFAETSRLVGPGGCLVAMKGIYPREELTRVPGDVRVSAVLLLDVPGVDDERHLVIAEKNSGSA